jgi:hypothetical protein
MISPERRFLLVLIMLWLPLQSAMAASMSLCTKEKDSVKLDTSVPTHVGKLPCAQERDAAVRSDVSVVTAADQHHNGNHEQSMQGIPDEVTFNLQCNGEPCHASCSVPISSAASGTIFTNSSAYTLSFTFRLTSLVLEQLQRPPLV